MLAEVGDALQGALGHERVAAESPLRRSAGTTGRNPVLKATEVKSASATRKDTTAGKVASPVAVAAINDISDYKISDYSTRADADVVAVAVANHRRYYHDCGGY